jgi:hypothetical protein
MCLPLSRLAASAALAVALLFIATAATATAAAAATATASFLAFLASFLALFMAAATTPLASARAVAFALRTGLQVLAVVDDEDLFALVRGFRHGQRGLLAV